jgi:hypothetical protein
MASVPLLVVVDLNGANTRAWASTLPVTAESIQQIGGPLNVVNPGSSTPTGIVLGNSYPTSGSNGQGGNTAEYGVSSTRWASSVAGVAQFFSYAAGYYGLTTLDPAITVTTLEGLGLSRVGQTTPYGLTDPSTAVLLTTTTTNTLTTGSGGQAGYPIIKLSTVTLTGSTSLVFPNAAGHWKVDMSAVTFSAGTLTFKSGTASCTGVTTLSGISPIAEVIAYGGNVITCNL